MEASRLSSHSFFTSTRNRLFKKAAPKAPVQEQVRDGDEMQLSGGPGFLTQLNRKVGKIGLGLCLMASLCGAANAAGGPSAGVAAEQFQQAVVRTIDNDQEQAMLSQNDACGMIVALAEGQDGKGAHLTVHGLGASPRAVKPLNDRAAAEGKDTSTFIYNDMKGCDHRMNSRALADELKEWASEHPNEPLTIETHSQGGRVAMGALRFLNKDGEFPDNPIQLTMISPPLGGFSLANIVLTAPGPLARLIPGAAPTRDMASWSGASRQIKNLKLPENVQTTIYYGSADRMVNYEKGGHKKVAENLDAEVYYIVGGTHTTTVPTVANPQPGDISDQPIAYNPSNKAAGAFLW